MSMIKKTVLVVDDDPVVQKAFGIKLKPNKFKVIAAKDGSTAVNIARTQPLDAIILDLNFPVDDAFGGVPWDGFRIMEWLQRINAATQVPIIVITSGNPEKYMEKAREHGAVAFFRKPVPHDELIAMIEQVTAAKAVTAS